jgi:hypothetical protein
MLTLQEPSTGLLFLLSVGQGSAAAELVKRLPRGRTLGLRRQRAAASSLSVRHGEGVASPLETDPDQFESARRHQVSEPRRPSGNSRSFVEGGSSTGKSNSRIVVASEKHDETRQVPCNNGIFVKLSFYKGTGTFEPFSTDHQAMIAPVIVILLMIALVATEPDRPENGSG